jgi:putative aldouronate transport system permease protein
MLSAEFKRQCKEDKIFDVINVIVLLVILLLVLFPLYFIVIASFSDPDAVANGKVWLLPVGFNLDGYAAILKHSEIWIGYKNTIIYTVVGTSVNIVLTICSAYALSRKELVGRNIIMSFITFTMFFSGGLIPTYLLVDKLGINNTMWALILPGAINVYNLIVARSYFNQTLPEELHEAAEVDGCTQLKFFWKIAIPLSKPIIGVIVLMYAVGHWNSYFNALIYLRERDKYPLQVLLRELLIQTETAAASSGGDAISIMEQQRVADMLKYGIIIISSLPILCVYPFIQKYFVKGVMIGAIKG